MVMITGFEDYTYELNEFELKVLVPIVARSWEKKSFNETLKMEVMIKGVRDYFLRNYTKEGEKLAKKITGPRLRKVLHHIRVQGVVPNLIATSKGYYKTADKEEMEKYIRSLWERSNSFREVAIAMENQYRKMLRV